MILWSIQNENVMKTLRRDGVYHTDKNFLWAPENEDTDANHTNYAYKWLAKKMAKIVGPPPKGVEYPIWAMYKEQGRGDGKPDLRSWGRDKSQGIVRLTLDIPDYEVMITDFDMWHCVLNYWYQSESEDDDDAFANWCKRHGIHLLDIVNWSKSSPKLEEARRRVESSWDRVIGISKMDPDWIGDWKSRSFQATFWELRMEHVIRCETFPAYDKS